MGEDARRHEAAVRLVTDAARAGLRLRLIGGIAVRARVLGLRSYDRPVHDIDLAYEGPRKALELSLSAAGLEPESRFNALHGRRRQVWWFERHTQVDVVVDELQMCHDLDLRGRVAVGQGPALNAADLLLTKLQIVELTDKDVTDVGALLETHELAEDDGPCAISVPRIQQVLGANWGFHTTVCDNLDRLSGAIGSRRAQELRTAVLDAPTTRAWRLRARVGRRVRWYRMPEEAVSG